VSKFSGPRERLGAWQTWFVAVICFGTIENDAALPISTNITVRANRLSYSLKQYLHEFLPSCPAHLRGHQWLLSPQALMPVWRRETLPRCLLIIPGNWYVPTHPRPYLMPGSCSALLFPLHLYGHHLYSHLVVFLVWPPEVAQCQV
jgi:hypothetical protein